MLCSAPLAAGPIGTAGNGVEQWRSGLAQHCSEPPAADPARTAGHGVGHCCSCPVQCNSASSTAGLSREATVSSSGQQELCTRANTSSRYPYWNFPAETSLFPRVCKTHQFTLPIRQFSNWSDLLYVPMLGVFRSYERSLIRSFGSPGLRFDLHKMRQNFPG